MTMAEDRTTLVPASPAGARMAAEAFDRFAIAGSLPPEVIRSVQIALDEVISNTVNHGYPSAADGRIEIRFRMADGVLEVTIQDDAPAFDLLARPDPDTTAALADRDVGGLGILLTRGLMDDVHYERTGGRNRVTLRKRTGASSGPLLPDERP